MSRRPDDERTYFLKRAADHSDLAAGCNNEDHRALHHRFARLYRERANAIGMVEVN